jgi:hypothetical protein
MLENLNIDNVVRVLNKSNLSDYNFMMYNSNNLQNYHIVIKSLLDNFFDYYQDKDFHIREKNNFDSAVILLNKKMTNVWMKDITEIKFISMYPNIIIKLWEQELLKFNIKEFGVLFKFIVHNKELIKEKLTNRNKGLLNFIINYTYGAVHNTNSIIKVDGLNLIISYYKDTLISLYDNYPNNVFYVDVDTIFLDFLDKTILDKYITPLDLPYVIEHHSGIFLMKKKNYILQTKDGIKTYGIENFNSEYKLEKDRIKKINNIKSKI